MYSFDCILDGVKHTVFLFSTFTGHFHPFTPYNPIDVDQAFFQERKTFYLAWYTGAEDNSPNQAPLKNAKLQLLEKYWLIFTPHTHVENYKQEPGRYFHTVAEGHGSFVIGAEIDPASAIKANLLYTYKVNQKKEVIESNIVKKGLMDKYTYTYKTGGAMEKVDIYRSAPPQEG